MNSRERILAMLVAGAVIIGAGGFMLYQTYLSPLNAKETSIQAARDDIKRKKGELEQARADHLKLERIKLLSLPGEPNLAGREYEKYLRSTMIGSGFPAAGIGITVHKPDARQAQINPKKAAAPVFTTLQFVVDASGKLENVIRMMEQFYRTGLLHAIKNFTVELPPVRESQQRPEDLKLRMTIETVIVNGVDNRPYLLPNIDRRLVAVDALTALRGGPSGLAWLTWAIGPTGSQGPGVLATKPRKYSSIAAKNIFLGMPDKEEIIETTRYVFLSQIVTGERYNSAYFYNRYYDQYPELGSRPGSNQAVIRSSSGEAVITIKAVRIDPRDVVFSVGDKYYTIHIGENLAYAMEEPLSEEQVEALLKDGAAASSK
jgi:hypothetical protein